MYAPPANARLALGDPAARGLVAAWACSEQGGAALCDLGPRRLDGSVSGTPTRIVGPRGRALALDGSTYVDYGSPAALDLIQAISVAAWVRRDDASRYFVVLARRGGGLQYQATWVMNAEGGQNNKLRWNFSLGGGLTFFNSAAAHPETGDWHHLAFCYDRANVCLYFDGQPDGVTAETRAIDSYAVGVYTGYDAQGGAQPKSIGSIADLRVWDRGLSAAEVLALYNER